MPGRGPHGLSRLLRDGPDRLSRSLRDGPDRLLGGGTDGNPLGRHSPHRPLLEEGEHLDPFGAFQCEAPSSPEGRARLREGPGNPSYRMGSAPDAPGHQAPCQGPREDPARLRRGPGQRPGGPDGLGPAPGGIGRDGGNPAEHLGRETRTESGGSKKDQGRGNFHGAPPGIDGLEIPAAPPLYRLETTLLPPGGDFSLTGP